MSAVFQDRRQGRSWKLGLMLVAVYAALLWLWLVLDAALWIIAIPYLATVPAVWDMARNPVAELTMDRRHLTWRSGGRSDSIPLDTIEKAQFDTRWDFSVRVTLLFRDGARMRLPMECTRAHRALETAMQDQNIPVERRHFAVF